MIEDMFMEDKIDCFNPSIFPRHRASASIIDYQWFLYGFANVYPSRTFPMLMGINYLLKLHGE
jgi:hypothetical protein